MKVEAAVLQQDSSSMAQISDGSAQLILTGPPYFDLETEKLLREPIEKQRNIDDVEQKLFVFARTLRPIFAECARILDRNGYLILQTKDIRYGTWLVPLVHEHEKLAFEYGFRVVTRLYWDPEDRPRRSNKNFKSNPREHSFRAREFETFSILCRKLGRPGEALPELVGASWLDEAVWRVSGETRTPRHPHASPPEVLRRLLLLFSRSGDLVVDPFCGGGGLLDIARKLGREAIGFEIDSERVQMARRRIEGVA
jgi:DNA modification methylase